MNIFEETADVGTNLVFHVKCGLNLGDGTLIYLFLVVEVDNRQCLVSSPTTIFALKSLCEVLVFEQIMSRGFTTIARLSYTVVF